MITARQALPLAGGWIAFSACEVITRTPAGRHSQWVSACDLPGFIADQPAAPRGRLSTLLERLTRAPAPLAGLALDITRPAIMGVVNVTPDSFSDKGRHETPQAAIAHGRALAAAGADILDIGGESTRPGARPVSPDEEITRIRPVIEGLKGIAPLSIDSRHGAVMAAALAAGAAMINDVTALEGPGSLALAAGVPAPVVLMHMQGTPGSMQDNPRYDDVLLDVYDYLERRLAACEQAGIARHRLIVDPGIGFGKNLAHNLALIDGLALFHGLGRPVLLGASRKSMIDAIHKAPADRRLGGSLVLALAGIERGAQILRVHDVFETVQARDVWFSLHMS
jgi:dihydropteroate synthase